MPEPAFDLSTTHVHLGLGSRAVPLPDFEWSAEYLTRYAEEHGTDGAERRIDMRAGEAVVNPRNVWHTADIEEPCQTLFVTPGFGTEHRPR